MRQHIYFNVILIRRIRIQNIVDLTLCKWANDLCVLVLVEPECIKKTYE